MLAGCLRHGALCGSERNGEKTTGSHFAFGINDLILWLQPRAHRLRRRLPSTDEDELLVRRAALGLPAVEARLQVVRVRVGVSVSVSVRVRVRVSPNLNPNPNC